MPRGGARKGQVGKNYSNRQDLTKVQAPKAPSGQGYGQAGAQLDAQKAIPLPNATNVTVNRGADGRISGVNVPQPTPQAPATQPPGSTTPLDAPTQRPGEPVTNGAPSGPGAGPSALGLQGGQTQVLDQLRLLFQQYPISEIADLIAEAS